MVFPEAKRLELKALSKASKGSEASLQGLTPLQQQWLLLYNRSQSQRYGYGLCVAPLIHSELWNDLKERGWKGDSKTRAFDNVIHIDQIYVSIVNDEAEKKKEPPANDPKMGLAKLAQQQTR